MHKLITIIVLFTIVLNCSGANSNGRSTFTSTQPNDALRTNHTIEVTYDPLRHYYFGIRTYTVPKDEYYFWCCWKKPRERSESISADLAQTIYRNCYNEMLRNQLAFEQFSNTILNEQTLKNMLPRNKINRNN